MCITLHHRPSDRDWFCWVDIGRCGDYNKVRIRVCSLCIQRCGQVQFFLCKILLNIIILNWRFMIVNHITFTCTMSTAITWLCCANRTLRERPTYPRRSMAGTDFWRIPSYSVLPASSYSHDGLLCCNRSRHSHSVPFGCRALWQRFLLRLLLIIASVRTLQSQVSYS